VPQATNLFTQKTIVATISPSVLAVNFYKNGNVLKLQVAVTGCLHP
jgi:hypothetical protein